MNRIENITLEGILNHDGFASQKDLIEVLSLEYLSKNTIPIGAWKLKLALQEAGVDISEANAGRVLMRLDFQGYTKLESSRGRVITEEGREFLRIQKQEVMQGKLEHDLIESVFVHNIEDLIDILRVRRAIEVEGAKLAAMRATDKDIEALLKNIETHKKEVEKGNDPTRLAFDFHLKLAEASHNKFIIALLKLIISEEEDLESKFGQLLTRERGGDYNIEHKLIVDAIRDKDSEEAQEQMEKHLTSLIGALKEQSVKLKENI